MNIDQATKVVQRRTRQLPYAPDLGIEHEPWMDSALCAQFDPDTFFPEKGNGAASSEAKRICSSCDVRSDCLLYALTNHEHYGIWGGLSEWERRKIERPTPRNYRHHDVAPCGTPAAYRRHYRRGEPIDDACRAAQQRAQTCRRRSRGIRGAA